MKHFDTDRHKDIINSARLAYLRAKRRHALWARLRVFAATAGVITLLVLVAGLFNQDPDSSGNKGLLPNLGLTGDSGQNPLAGKKLYVDPDSNAARQADLWRPTMPDQAMQMDKLADQASAKWFSNAITYDDVHNYVQAANDDGAVPLTVAYYIPQRDCNKYSSGGAANEMAYYDYIDTYAKAIGQLQAVVILEPDALVHTKSNGSDGQPCLTDTQRQMYYGLLSYAVDRFKSLPATTVYIDAGNSGWAMDAKDLAQRLDQSGIDKADGFALNVSNFRRNDETIKLGTEIAKETGGKHFVIDTSRNGLGPYDNPENPAYNWCNPPDRALGHYPTADTGVKYLDAYLFIKTIGESDGADPDPKKCYGGPKAGMWWPEYALGLVERWPAELQFGYQRP